MFRISMWPYLPTEICIIFMNHRLLLRAFKYRFSGISDNSSSSVWWTCWDDTKYIRYSARNCSIQRKTFSRPYLLLHHHWQMLFWFVIFSSLKICKATTTVSALLWNCTFWCVDRINHRKVCYDRFLLIGSRWVCTWWLADWFTTMFFNHYCRKRYLHQYSCSCISVLWITPYLLNEKINNGNKARSCSSSGRPKLCGSYGLILDIGDCI